MVNTIVSWFRTAPISFMCFFISITLLVLLDAFGLSLFYGSIDWNTFGNVATWLSAVLSFAAVMVAYFAIISQQNQFQDEIKAQNLTNRTRVFGWYQKELDHAGRNVWFARIQNMTDSPIYSWRLEFLRENYSDTSTDSTRFGPAIPGQNMFQVQNKTLSDELSNGEQPLRFEFEFVDVSGRTYRRLGNGNLMEVDDA